MKGAPIKNPTVGQLAKDALAGVEVAGLENCYALIACSKSKRDHRAPARDMYVSPLYRKSVRVVESLGLSFSILSAKHGLLTRDQIIEPYDLTLKGKSKEFKANWAARVHEQLVNSVPSDKQLLVFGGDDYYAPLIDANPNRASKFHSPMRGLSLGNRLAFLNQCIRNHDRKKAISRVYELFRDIIVKVGCCSLNDILSKPLPKQGVYFFFDKDEPTKFSNDIPRLVRIGTHGVSAGSKATLRNRLRTHFGTRSGLGNHRASVFRLHVGRAMIERDNLRDEYPDWGKGQSSSKEIRDQEVALEQKVSNYIGQLIVLYIPISDASGINSMRATVERQFIALFTETMNIIEGSSSRWLGGFSDKAKIRDSGLWNVRDVGGDYDLRFVPLFESMVSKEPFPETGTRK